MTKLNPIPEPINPRFSGEKYRALVAETEELTNENAELKERIDYLERQIATHSYAGWQIH